MHPVIYLYIYSLIHISINLSIYLFIYLSIYSSIYLSIYPIIHLYNYLLSLETEAREIIRIKVLNFVQFISQAPYHLSIFISSYLSIAIFLYNNLHKSMYIYMSKYIQGLTIKRIDCRKT